MKLIDLLIQSAAKYPNKIVVRDDTCEMTYTQLLSNTKRLSNILKSSGCGPGVKIAIVLPNCVAYFASFFAISEVGATIIPMSSKMTVYEIVGFIKRADITMVITTKKIADKLREELENEEYVAILTAEQRPDYILAFGTFVSYPDRLNRDNEDVSLMVYTSGTTGQAKIVMLTDSQLISNMLAYRGMMNFCNSNVVYCSLPFHHIYCICAQILTHISLGDTFIVTANPFFVKDFLRQVQEYKITITALVPYLAMLISEYPNLDCFDISSLKYITLSSSSSSNILRQKLITTFPCINFIDAYGMSEAGPRISLTVPRLQDCPVGSVGKPIYAVKIRITNFCGCVLPVGQIGEIEISSPGIFKGYYNQPKLTKETVVDGWLKTGDLGKLDIKGNLYLFGRKKEIILCGGENILPAEIEETIQKNDFVREVAVVGIPDSRFQEVPCAFVVSRGGSCNETNIMDFCRKRLSSFKVPRKVFFVDKLPKLGTSKIDRRGLKEIALSKLRVEL